MTADKRSRPGRPRGGDSPSGVLPNRHRILAAARAEFAAKGFRGATLRSIAASAGVDVALIAHYFGNKEDLFAETLEFPVEAGGAVSRALSGPPGSQAEGLCRAYLGLWEDPATGPQVLAMARATFSDDHARRGLARAVLGMAEAPEVAPLLAGRQVGLQLAMAHLVGVAMQRHMMPGSLASQMSFDALVARVAPAVDLHLRTPDA